LPCSTLARGFLGWEQPEHRAAIIIYAAEHGVRAIYAEKALCASVHEAEAIHACLKKNGAL
jgi:predicted dehydrogenase